MGVGIFIKNKLIKEKVFFFELAQDVGSQAPELELHDAKGNILSKQ
jgi:hypothetical protein